VKCYVRGRKFPTDPSQAAHDRREDLARARRAAAGADVFLAVGTSLTVYPAAGLPEFALAHQARLVVLNAEPTPHDGAADAVVREPLGTVLPAIAAALERLGISDP